MPDQSSPASSQSEISQRNSQFWKQKFPKMGECELHITLLEPKQGDGPHPLLPMELGQISRTLLASFAKSLSQMMDGNSAGLTLNKQSLEKSGGSVVLFLEIGLTLTPVTEGISTQPSVE